MDCIVNKIGEIKNMNVGETTSHIQHTPIGDFGVVFEKTAENLFNLKAYQDGVLLQESNYPIKWFEEGPNNSQNINYPRELSLEQIHTIIKKEDILHAYSFLKNMDGEEFNGNPHTHLKADLGFDAIGTIYCFLNEEDGISFYGRDDYILCMGTINHQTIEEFFDELFPVAKLEECYENIVKYFSTYPPKEDLKSPSRLLDDFKLRMYKKQDCIQTYDLFEEICILRGIDIMPLEDIKKSSLKRITENGSKPLIVSSEKYLYYNRCFDKYLDEDVEPIDDILHINVRNLSRFHYVRSLSSTVKDFLKLDLSKDTVLSSDKISLKIDYGEFTGVKITFNPEFFKYY